MSSEDNKSINQSFNRQSMIGNFNSWINDLGSAALTHLLNFRRRNSKGSTTFTLAPLFTRSDSYSNTSTTGSDEGSQDDGYDRDFSDNHHGKEREPGRLLNGTLNRTLKTKELIELHNFGIVEVSLLLTKNYGLKNNLLLLSVFINNHYLIFLIIIFTQG